MGSSLVSSFFSGVRGSFVVALSAFEDTFCHSDGNSVDSYCPMLGYVFDWRCVASSARRAGVVPVHRAETIVLEWSLDMCIILILASTEDLNEKRRLEFNEDMKAKY